MWRDPLDELIEDLEQVVSPPAPRTQLPSFAELLTYTDIIRLHGRSGRVKERLEKEPGFHRFLAQMRGRVNPPADGVDAAPASQTPEPTDRSHRGPESGD